MKLSLPRQQLVRGDRGWGCSNAEWVRPQFRPLALERWEHSAQHSFSRIDSGAIVYRSVNSQAIELSDEISREYYEQLLRSLDRYPSRPMSAKMLVVGSDKK